MTTAEHRVPVADPIDGPHSVLLIHGRPRSVALWSRVRPLLSTYGLRVLSVVHSDAGAPTDHFRDAASIAEVLDERLINPTVVVGHGVGAGTALALAATAPQRVRALVLVAPAVSTSTLTGGRRNDQLSRIDCPVIIVAGTRDRVAGSRVADTLVRRLPATRLVSVDAGHFVPIDDPHAIGNAVLGALRWQYRDSLRPRRFEGAATHRC